MKNFFRKLIELSGYTLQNLKALDTPQRQKPITREDFFNLYFSKIDPENFFFVEIGASDGVGGDPIRPYVTRHRLRGVVVEPIPESFRTLQENYNGYPVTCVNVAIGSASGTVPFYTISELGKQEPVYTRLLAVSSLDKSHVEQLVRRNLKRHDVERFIKKIDVPVLSFADLAHQYAIERVDMLQIDAEGYDWKILQTIDLSRFSPSLINVETGNLSDEDREALDAYLAERGYKTFRYGIDTVAYKI